MSGKMRGYLIIIVGLLLVLGALVMFREPDPQIALQGEVRTALDGSNELSEIGRITYSQVIPADGIACGSLRGTGANGERIQRRFIYVRPTLDLASEPQTTAFGDRWRQICANPD